MNDQILIRLEKTVAGLKNNNSEFEQLKEKYKFFESMCAGYLAEIQDAIEAASDKNGYPAIINKIEELPK